MNTVSLTTLCILSVFALQTAEAVCKTDTLTALEQTILDDHNALRKLHSDTADLCYGESGDDITFASQEWATAMAAAKEMTHSTRLVSFLNPQSFLIASLRKFIATFLSELHP